MAFVAACTVCLTHQMQIVHFIKQLAYNTSGILTIQNTGMQIKYTKLHGLEVMVLHQGDTVQAKQYQ